MIQNNKLFSEFPNDFGFIIVLWMLRGCIQILRYAQDDTIEL